MCNDRVPDAVHPPDRQKAYICTCVFELAKPVLLVSRQHGDWMLLCGDEHPDIAESYHVVGIGHEFEKDPSLLDLVDLPPEWEAERSAVGEEWIRSPALGVA